MNIKSQRISFIMASSVILIIAVYIILSEFKQQIIFYYSPTQFTENLINQNNKIRVGGIIKEGSINKIDELNIEFILTDNINEVKVKYHGLLPPMFRENQGMVAQGMINNAKILNADNLLTKHDENYMPPELKKTLSN